MNFNRYETDAQPLEGPLLNCLRDLAKALKIMLHTGSFVEKKGDHFYNTSVLVSPEGDILDVYRKSICLDFNPGKHRF